MIRRRIWNKQSSASVCAFCQHPALAHHRDLGRRNYSDTSHPPSNNGGDSRASASKHGANPTASSTGPRIIPSLAGSSGWGAPVFGGGVPPRAATGPAVSGPNPRMQTDSIGPGVLDGLLPHERAARKKLEAQKAAQPTPDPQRIPPNLQKFTASSNGSNQSSHWFQRALGDGSEGSNNPFRGPLNDVVPAKSRPLGGFESRPENTSRWQDKVSKDYKPNLQNAKGHDWRHREMDRKPIPGSDRRPPSTPIPHHRHAAREQIRLPSAQGAPSRQSLRPTSSAANDSANNPDDWGLLARKPRKSLPSDTPASMTRDVFLSQFQENMDRKYSGISRQSRPTPSPLGTVKEIPEESTAKGTEEASERRASRFDENYEIDRDSRRRDKAGSRRGENLGPHGGSKKSASQRRWEDEYEEWDEVGANRAAERRQRKAKEKALREAKAAAAPKTIFLPEFISISNLALALKIKTRDFLAALEEMGFEDITEDSIMTGETAALVAMEYGFEPTVDTGGVRDLRPRPPPEDVSSLPQRPPVVTIMGHVDHGKTTLLDYLRKSSVAAQEHGGITQHIGAFRVKMSSGKLITFLDTPGHAAFLTMRQRGANVTDIVVLVVAADDSVKPQTLEALKHANAAKVPIIVAINKIDKEDARPDQVKADLARHGVEIEDFGGDVQVVCVSGKTGQGMSELEENIVTLAEIQDVRAENDGMAEAWVLEASIKPYGKSANILVKRGTLRVGDFVVAGTTWARIRLLRDEAGHDLEEAPPGTPVEVLGWREELPLAGDEVLQAPDEDRARTAVEYREEMREREASSKQLAEQEQRERIAKAAAAAAEADPEATETEAAEGPGVQTVNFLVRGDVVGSVEAVCATINEIGNNEVKPRILRSSAGQVSETDVEHAEVSGSIIVNFNSAVSGHIKHLAEERGVRILDHTIIYHLSDEVKQVMSEKLPEKVTYKVTGEAEVLQVFPINIKGRVYKNIAGCKVRNGMVTRSGSVRIFRKGEKIFDGKIDALKHGKKDVTEIRKGSECGVSFEDFADLQTGDQIQVYESISEKRSL